MRDHSRVIVTMSQRDLLKAMRERQEAEDWLRRMGMHKTLPAPVITSVRYGLTPEQKAEQDEYIKANNLPF